MPDQFPIGQRVALEHDHERVAEEKRVLAPVEPELDLVQIAGQVLDADPVECADDGAVEQGPNAFDALSVNVTLDPFLGSVIDVLMPASVSATPEGSQRGRNER